VFSRTRYQYGSWKLKNGKRERRYGNFDTTNLMHERTPAPGCHGWDKGRVSDRIRREKVASCTGDPIAAECRPTECGGRFRFWSGDGTIRARKNAGTVFHKGSVPVVHQLPVPGELQNGRENRASALLRTWPRAVSYVKMIWHTMQFRSCNSVTELEPRSPSLRSELIPKNIGRD